MGGRLSYLIKAQVVAVVVGVVVVIVMAVLIWSVMNVVNQATLLVNVAWELVLEVQGVGAGEAQALDFVEVQVMVVGNLSLARNYFFLCWISGFAFLFFKH